MNPQVVWHGTAQEACALAESVTHNCTCTFGPDNVRLATCAAHHLLLDQHGLDRLLFARYIAAQLRDQEFSIGGGEPQS